MEKLMKLFYFGEKINAHLVYSKAAVVYKY